MEIYLLKANGHFYGDCGETQLLYGIHVAIRFDVMLIMCNVKLLVIKMLNGYNVVNVDHVETRGYDKVHLF